jgi:hypothetical protein
MKNSHQIRRILNNIRFNILTLLAISILLTALFSDAKSESNPVSKKKDDQKTKVKAPQVCTIFIDGTSSYTYLSKAKQTALKKIFNLPPGSKVYVRWITDDSFSDGCSIHSFIVPQKPEKIKNPFANPKIKKGYKTKVLKYKYIWKKLASKIQKAQSPNSNSTDIMGALLAASKRFRYNPDYQPSLIMLTDMDDNAHKKYDNIDLKNALVQLLDYQVDSKQNDRQEIWVDRLTSLGASAIKVAFLDDIIDYSY